MSQKILNIATALIVDKNQNVLLIKRVKDPYKNWWAFPGGKQEFGETLIEAMQREIFEETKIDLNTTEHRGRIISIVNETVEEQLEFEKYIDSGEKKISTVNHFDSHFVLTYWIVELHLSYQDLGFQTINQGDEGIQQWFSFEKIPELIPSDKTILERYIKGNNEFQLIECVIRQDKLDDKDDLKLINWNIID